MKKLISLTFLVLVAIVVISLSSCDKATYIKVDTDTISAMITGASGEIKVETDAKKVEVAYAPKWVNASYNDSLKVVQYEIGVNADRKLREDSIVIKCANMTHTILVKQSFKASYIKFNPSEASIPREGGTVEVEVEVDSEGPLSIDNQNIASVNGRTITIKMGINPNTGKRNKKITVKCDDITETLNVTQESNCCPMCGGEGYLDEPCHECGGEGLHYCCNFTGKELCPKCYGSGKIVW